MKELAQINRRELLENKGIIVEENLKLSPTGAGTGGDYTQLKPHFSWRVNDAHKNRLVHIKHLQKTQHQETNETLEKNSSGLHSRELSKRATFQITSNDVYISDFENMMSNPSHTKSQVMRSEGAKTIQQKRTFNRAEPSTLPVSPQQRSISALCNNTNPID